MEEEEAEEEELEEIGEEVDDEGAQIQAQPDQAQPDQAQPSPEKIEMIKYSTEEIGIQGNWRKKKDWLKQAVEKNNSIQKIVADTAASRKSFHDKFKEIDFELDKFYRQSGFDKGEVETLFKEIDEEIETAKEKNKRLFSLSLSQIDEHSREEAEKIKEQYADAYKIEEEFKGYKNKLEQVKLDMKSIVDLDGSVRERLQTVDKQIDELNKQGDSSQKLQEKAWHIIDDKKARDAFYKLSGQEEKVKNIQQYVKVDLSKDFDSVIGTIRNQIEKTNSDIQKLEDDGIIVVNRSERIEEERKKKLELIKQKELEAKTRKPKKTVRKKVEKKSWLSSIFSWIYEFLFG